MPGLGIHTQEQFTRMGPERRVAGVRAAYNLLDIGANPTEEQIRVFEDVSYKLRTSNGTFRTSSRHRLPDVDAVATRLMRRFWPLDAPLSIEDRAVSHALTSCEWAKPLFRIFPNVRFEASDRLTYLLELTLTNGDIYIAERDGAPLQWIKPPYVVAIDAPESWRNPWLRMIAAGARRRYAGLKLPAGWTETSDGPGFKVRRISCIHPEAAALLAKDPRFQVAIRSVFDITAGGCDVIRTVNILNKDYFPDAQLREGAEAVFASLRDGGIWIVGRTYLEDSTNHVAFLRRNQNTWEVLERIGGGSEVESIALRDRS